MPETAADFSLEEQHFRISPKGMAEPVFQMPAADWLKPARAREALERAGAYAKATGMELPASMAGHSLFNVFFVKLLHLVRHGRALDVRLEHLTLQMEVFGGWARIGYRMQAGAVSEGPEERSEAALEADWTAFFRDQIRPAVEAVADSAGVKPALIWNQFGGQLAAMRDYWGKIEPNILSGGRFDRHAALVKERLAPEAFACRRNPFVCIPRYVENPWQPGGRLVIRSSCCMYDRREGGQKCYNCPRLLPEERERLKEGILAAAATSG